MFSRLFAFAVLGLVATPLWAANCATTVDADGAKAGLGHNYLKPGTQYVFFCSFPGHPTIMHGTVTLTK